MGADALHDLGMRAHLAHRAALRFRRHDEEALHDLTGEFRDRATYISAARGRIQALEDLMRADRDDPGLDRDQGWDAESLREDFGRRPPG